MSASPEQSAVWSDWFQSRERNPHYDESIWIGRCHVRVIRYRHWSYWRVTGDLMTTSNRAREEIAAWVRLGAGLPLSRHDLIWHLIWYSRTNRRGGTGRGLVWEGTIHALIDG